MIIECIPYGSLLNYGILLVVILWVIEVLLVGLGNGVMVVVVMAFGVSSGVGHDQASFWDLYVTQLFWVTLK